MYKYRVSYTKLTILTEVLPVFSRAPVEYRAITVEYATMCIANSSPIHISRISTRLIRSSTNCVVETVSLTLQKHQSKYM